MCPGEITGTIVNSGQGSQTFELADGTDLGYIVIRHGNDFIIWTPRPATDDEINDIKEKVVKLSNQFSGITTATGNSMRIISGVPHTVNVGKKEAVSVYMKDDEVWIKFLDPSAWSDFAYGKIPYTYTPAGGEDGGTITNTKKVTDFAFVKKWLDMSGQDIDWDQDIEVTVRRKKADDSVDDTFLLKYAVTKSAVVSMTGNTAEFSGENATDPKLVLTVTQEGGKKQYSFKIENLPFCDEDDGKYTYYVTETNAQLESYLEPTYSNPGDQTGTGTEGESETGTERF